MSRALAAGVVALAAFLRLWGLGDLPSPLWDEWLHVPTAHNYAGLGLIAPDDWWHPPLKHLLRSAAIAVMGESTLAYRLPNALLGTAAVALVILVTRRLTPSRGAPVAAGALLAFDPLHVVLSRTTPEEVVASAALLLTLWFALRALERPFPSAIGVGLAIGLAMATKWYYGPAAALLAAAVAWRGVRDDPSPGRMAYLAAALVLLPGAVYLAVYLPWFSAGHGLGDFFQLQLDAARMVRLIREDFGSAVFLSSRAAIDWFTRPLAMGVSYQATDGPHYLLFLTLFPWTALVLPAAAWAAWRSWRLRSLGLGLVASAFLLSYGQFLLLRRPIYVYSAGSVLPLAWILVSVCVADLLAGAPRLRRAALTLLAGGAVAAVWVTFPLLSGGRATWWLPQEIVARAAVKPGF